MTLMESRLLGSHFKAFPLGSFPSVLLPRPTSPGTTPNQAAKSRPLRNAEPLPIVARSHPVSDIEQGYISTASCILANNSMKLGRSLAWDPEKQLVVGDSEANALLRQEYRAPYTHPEA